MTRLKDKQRILKAAGEKQVVTYKGTAVILASDCSTDTFQDRMEWREIFMLMKRKDPPKKAILPARLSFKIKGEIRSFPDKKNLRSFVTPKQYCNTY